MQAEDIARVITDFGQAARRCYEGGLDGCELHITGHLIGQFCHQPRTSATTILVEALRTAHALPDGSGKDPPRCSTTFRRWRAHGRG